MFLFIIIQGIRQGFFMRMSTAWLLSTTAVCKYKWLLTHMKVTGCKNK